MSIDRQRIAAVSEIQRLGYVWKDSAWQPPAEPDRGFDLDEVLKLMDHVYDLVLFACANAPVHRYYRGAHAMWAVVYRLVGKHDLAERNIADLKGHLGK